MNKKTLIVIIAIIVVGFFFGGSILFNQLNSNTVSQNSSQSDSSAPASRGNTNTSSSATAAVSTDTALPAPVAPSSAPTALQIKDVTVGNGAVATNGMTVTVHYLGTLMSGQKFDASADHGQPFSFTLGAGQVIKGWDQGVLGMKVGGTRMLAIPSSLAYGSQAVGPIPPNSALLFTVQLVNVSK